MDRDEGSQRGFPSTPESADALGPETHVAEGEAPRDLGSVVLQESWSDEPIDDLGFDPDPEPVTPARRKGKRVVAAVVAVAACVAAVAAFILTRPPAQEPSVWAIEPSEIVATGDEAALDIDEKDAPYVNRYYYKNLADDQKVWYRSMYNALAVHKQSASVSGEYGEYMRTALHSVFMDSPEVFYARMGGSYVSDQGVTQMSFDYMIDAQTANQRARAIEARAADAMAYIGQQPTQADTVRAMNRWLGENIVYNRVASESTDDEIRTNFAETNTVYGALVSGDALCGGYALAVNYLCRLYGIDCVYIEGYVSEGEYMGVHAWDVVQADGVWSNVDATWNDYDNLALVTEDYCLVPDSVHNANITELYCPATPPACA